MFEAASVGHEVVFLPMTTVRRRDRGGRYSMVQVPLFTSYLFLEHTPGTAWRGVGGCPGVATLLRNGYEPAYVKIGVIELLRATDAARQDPAPEPSWKPGMACLINAGAFIGHEAVIIDVQKASARVALPVFGQLTTVSVPIAVALTVTVRPSGQAVAALSGDLAEFLQATAQAQAA
jgi:transcription antitermination factor NusG